MTEAEQEEAMATMIVLITEAQAQSLAAAANYTRAYNRSGALGASLHLARAQEWLLQAASQAQEAYEQAGFALALLSALEGLKKGE